MALSLWLVFIATFGSALAIPVPNAAYAIAQTLPHGPRHGLLAAAGFVFASGLYIVIVMIGIGLVITVTATILSFLVCSTYALVTSRLIARLKPNTANRIVGTAYTVAAGAQATIQQ